MRYPAGEAFEINIDLMTTMVRRAAFNRTTTPTELIT